MLWRGLHLHHGRLYIVPTCGSCGNHLYEETLQEYRIHQVPKHMVILYVFTLRSGVIKALVVYQHSAIDLQETHRM